MRIRFTLFVFLLTAFLGLNPVPGQAETQEKTLHILVSNDDGIDAEGIAALAEALRTFARVTVVAPAANSSGAGHSITTKGPLMVSEVKKNGAFFGFSVEATPATCVKLGLDTLLDEQPDLVVSGINEGFNIGEVIYNSGTFGAALEGVLNGIPGIAVSLERSKDKDMDYVGAAEFVKAYVQAQAKAGFPKDRVININIPSGKREEWKGVALTSLSDFAYSEQTFRRKTPWGKPYYWRMIKRPAGYRPAHGSDCWAIDSGMISITPVALVPTALEARTLGKLHLEFDGHTINRR